MILLERININSNTILEKNTVSLLSHTQQLEDHAADVQLSGNWKVMITENSRASIKDTGCGQWAVQSCPMVISAKPKIDSSPVKVLNCFLDLFVYWNN